VNEIFLSAMISLSGLGLYDNSRDLVPVIESCSVMGKIGFILSYGQIMEGDISYNLLMIDEISKEYSPLTSQMYKEFIFSLSEQVSELETSGDYISAMTQSLNNSHAITNSCIKYYMEKK